MKLATFRTLHLPPEAEKIRKEIRVFLADELRAGRFAPHRESWASVDPEFSRRLGQAGFIGITWPKEYGGQERSNFERFVVTEELLAAGTPCSAHWTADRQVGPQILHFGSARAKREILPRICEGECLFALGMSEPGAGSDLAAVSTRAERTTGGWHVSGSKIWTSVAHVAHYMLAIVRTSPKTQDRHAGLTDLIIDMKQPGVTVRPIPNMAGTQEFSQVFLENCFVPDDMVVGEVGSAWSLLTKELAMERSGPERFMSDFRLLVETIKTVASVPDVSQAREIGRLVSQVAVLRQMSISIAGMIEDGDNMDLEAALMKELGCDFEREVPEVARRITAAEPTQDDAQDVFADALAHVILRAPSFTIRGGTREIMRGIIARGLGLR